MMTDQLHAATWEELTAASNERDELRAEVKRLREVAEAAQYYINKSDGSGYFALTAAVRRLDSDKAR